jgi:long-subunit fatty acid transport protein
VIIDQPIGANVAYPLGTGYPIAGSTGEIRSTALTGVLRYAFDGGFSVYGGVRAVRTSGSVSLPAAGGYTMSTNTDMSYGYLVGVAYERPEIAARVSLTYSSPIKHTFKVNEFGAPSAPFSITIPESVNLEFQTGIMEDTLLFGGIRWVRWSRFDITPVTYTTAVVPGGSLVDYDKPTITYTLGVGRRFNENWSGAVSIGYEKKGGGISGNLGPTDGFLSLGIGATYTMDNIKISGGVQYRRIGSTTTRIAGFDNSFSGNSSVSAGLRVGFSF